MNGIARCRGSLTFTLVEERLESLGWMLPDAVARAWWATICQTVLPELYADGAVASAPLEALQGTAERERGLAERAARGEALRRPGDVDDPLAKARHYPAGGGRKAAARHQSLPGGGRAPIRPEILELNGGAAPPRTTRENRATARAKARSAPFGMPPWRPPPAPFVAPLCPDAIWRILQAQPLPFLAAGQE